MWVYVCLTQMCQWNALVVLNNADNNTNYLDQEQTKH